MGSTRFHWVREYTHCLEISAASTSLKFAWARLARSVGSGSGSGARARAQVRVRGRADLGVDPGNWYSHVHAVGVPLGHLGVIELGLGVGLGLGLGVRVRVRGQG